MHLFLGKWKKKYLRSLSGYIQMKKCTHYNNNNINSKAYNWSNRLFDTFFSFIGQITTSTTKTHPITHTHTHTQSICLLNKIEFVDLYLYAFAASCMSSVNWDPKTIDCTCATHQTTQHRGTQIVWNKKGNNSTTTESIITQSYRPE